jgi:hypothetical protein
MLSISDEVHALARLAHMDCAQFKHVVIGRKLSITNTTNPQTLLTYIIPENYALIITEIAFRSIPTPNDAGLTVGDWRSYDFDAKGTTKVYLDLNGSPYTGTNLTYFALLNRPVLFGFKGGQTIDLIAVRGAASVPATFVGLVVLNAYLTLPCAVDAIAGNITNAEGEFS